MLLGRDGLSALARLRAKGVTTAVISLTGRKELGDRMEGLSLRADDSLAKPFSVEELHARRLALNLSDFLRLRFTQVSTRFVPGSNS